MDNETRTAVLDALTDDGDTYELPDGRALRLRVRPDENTDINDYDCYGKVEWVKRHPYLNHDAERPEGFTGRARKLTTITGDAFWWEPYYEKGLVWTPEQWREETGHIRDLMSFGFHGLVLELLDGRDAYGRPIVTKVVSLWGVDDISDVRFALDELLDELLDQSDV